MTAMRLCSILTAQPGGEHASAIVTGPAKELTAGHCSDGCLGYGRYPAMLGCSQGGSDALTEFP